MAFWGNKVKDPVCGMEIDKKKAPASVAHGGADYFFCSPGCKANFEKSPDRFIGKSSSPQPQTHMGDHH